MTFNAALSGSDYTLLRNKNYAGDYLITLCANRVVFAGQVNTDLSVLTTWAQFDYNTVTVGSYPDVAVGQTLLIGTTNDITKAEYRGRIRLPAASNAIFCSESSQNFSIGAYWWVIDTYDPQYKLSRPDNNGVEFVDYAVGYEGPEPMVIGLRLAYVDNVNSGTGKMRVAFDVSSSYATVPSGTISSYQFTFKASSYTVISGSLSSSAVTVDFDPGEQWGKLVITDSGGITKTRHFYIKAIDADNPADLGFDNCTITGDLNRGWVLSIPAFAGVDSVLRDTFCVVWRANEVYGGTAGQLYPANNIAFTGWLQREDVQAQADQTASITEDVRFEFTGIGPRMARLTAQLLAIRIAGSPAVWGELSTLTPWRAICHFLSRYTTVANLCDIDFSDKSDTFLFPAINTQGGNVFTAVSGMAGQIDALCETAPDGRIQFNRNAEFLDATQRSTLTTVANFTTDDLLAPAAKTQEQNRSVGIVDGDAATYNSVTGQVTVFTARAPGHAQGEAQGRSTLAGQILTYDSDPFAVLDELRLRVGQKYEIDNNSETLSTEHPDGYAPLFIPSKGQLYTFTLAALTANGVDRINYTTSQKWTLESVTLTRQGNGATGVRCQWRILNRVGDLGDNTTLVPENSIPDPAPDLGIPAFNFEDTDTLYPEDGWTAAEANPAQLIPPPGTVLATNGNSVIASNGTNAWLLKNFIALKVPQAVDVTPSDLGAYTIKQVLFDPFGTSTAQGAYILASDGTNSAVWYTPNVAAVSPVWTKGVVMTGVFTVIRACNAAGKVLVYAPDTTGGGSTTVNYDFTASDGGWTAFNDNGPQAAYVPGSGWSYADNTDGSGNHRRTATISHNYLSAAVTAIAFVYNLTKGNYEVGTATALFINSNGSSLQSVQASSATNQTGATYGWTGSAAGNTQIDMGVVSSYQLHTPADFSGSCLITSAIVTFTTLGGAIVRYSSDYGESFAQEISVGSGASGATGFDTQRSGTNSFAACSGKIRRATTLGGAYSDYYAPTGSAQATCVIVPYYKWGSTTVKNTNATNPDIVVGLSAADGSSRTLLWIEGGATPGTVHDITPVASYVFDSSNAITTSYGKYIAAIGKVSGTYTLRVSKTLGGAGTWSNIATLTSPHFIRTRRNDGSAVRGKGQLYVTNGNAISYSGYWGANGIFPRTMPASGVDSFDILG
jgi:hypothetical protein